MAIVCAGYRTGGDGHHQTTFEGAELALGRSVYFAIAYFDACRRKRNLVDYDCSEVTSETEAQNTRSEVNRFAQVVEDWIDANHPQFSR